VLRGENAVAVNLEKLVHGGWLGERNAVARYFLMVYIYQSLVWKTRELLARYLDDMRISNH